MPTKNCDLIRIVDDDESIRDALSFLLEGEGWTTRAYPDAQTFLEEDDPTQPGCILLDVRMQNSISGLELQEKLLALSSCLPIIFISAHGDIEMAVHTMRNGAFDFLQKPIDEAKLLTTIGRAIDHCHEVLQHKHLAKAKHSNWDSLTHREKEVAMELARGSANKTVAARLGMTIRTAQVHRAAIYLKLNVHSAAEIANLLRDLEM